MRFLPMLMLALAALGTAVAAPQTRLSAEAWARPRSGPELLAMPALREVAGYLLAHPDSRLVIHHPGGEAGSLWAAELEDWLIALGIPGARQELAAGGVEAGYLRLRVEDAGRADLGGPGTGETP